MNVNQKYTIVPFASVAQNAILEILSQGPITGSELIERSMLTRQGVYKTLRGLLKDEVIIKEGKLFTLNKVWFSRMKSFIEEGEQGIGLTIPSKRKTLSFRSAHALDIYWGHLFLTLVDTVKEKPLFFFNRYNWAIYNRPESEAFLYKKTKKSGQKVFITLGTNTKLSQMFKRQYATKDIQIAIDENFSASEYENICIANDYVIVTRYDPLVAKKLHTLFEGIESFGEQEQKILDAIVIELKSIKVIIEKNPKKALILKRKLSKNFVVDKNELG